uniref:Cytochrome c assembly protein domain-containing protein n=1 Tax=Fagus sylvatica TaxID=28930 RepID=A0A2N9GHJ8_FAGSY
MGIRWFDKPRKNNHRLVLTLKRPALPNIDAKKTLYLQAPLLGWASLDAPTPNKLLVGIVELSLEKNRTFDGPALFYAPLYPERKMSFAPLGARRSHGSREGKRTHPLLHLARDDKERASSIDEQRIDGALGIALFFSPFLSASSDPFVRNFFVRTEPLAESNPVPQDPISAIHPPCIYAGDVASAMGFGLCRSKMMNGIVALHSPPMRKDAAEKNGTLLRSAGCVGSRITSELFTLKFKGVGAKYYPALLLRSNRSLLMLLRRRFFAFSSLWTGALVDTGREQAKRVVRNGKKDTTTSPLCWTAGANTVVSDQDQEPIRIWILTCRWFLTVGILPGSWWAHHELGRGGWWFRDPVENASFMPRPDVMILPHTKLPPPQTILVPRAWCQVKSLDRRMNCGLVGGLVLRCQEGIVRQRKGLKRMVFGLGSHYHLCMCENAIRTALPAGAKRLNVQKCGGRAIELSPLIRRKCLIRSFFECTNLRSAALAFKQSLSRVQGDSTRLPPTTSSCGFFNIASSLTQERHLLSDCLSSVIPLLLFF